MIIWLASIQPLQITAFKAKVKHHQCKHSLFHTVLCSVWPDRSSDCWLHWDVEETDLWKEWGSNYSISLLIFLHQLFHCIWLLSPGEVIAMCLLFLITLQRSLLIVENPIGSRFMCFSIRNDEWNVDWFKILCVINVSWCFFLAWIRSLWFYSPQKTNMHSI